ncbi:glutathione S-transferase family protein [Acuticoccus kandeliae]|uniref:glutathione S-transferase family protein n=1 Tax=Acuticoccus kandeliae TaxID=2073160 RepID=UPI000D3EAC3A|nr:glutathione S-transferase family protein [Acuticoccus kandeliae]
MELLFSDLSPYGRKIRILLAELDLAFTPNQYDRMRPVEAIGPINPNLTIPVLVDGDETLFDSHVIAAYLLETYGERADGRARPPLLATPVRPEARWADETLRATLQAFSETIIALFLYGGDLEDCGTEPATLPYHRRQLERIRHQLDWLDARATREGFAPGAFCLADIEFICAVGMVDAGAMFPWRDRAALATLVDHFADRPSVAATRPRPRG